MAIKDTVRPKVLIVWHVLQTALDHLNALSTWLQGQNYLALVPCLGHLTSITYAHFWTWPKTDIRSSKKLSFTCQRSLCDTSTLLLSQTIPTTLPTIPYPRTTLPRRSQPWGHPSPMDPSPLYFHHHDTLSLHQYLLLSCYLVIPCSIISLILPCTHCPSPGYLVHLS